MTMTASLAASSSTAKSGGGGTSPTITMTLTVSNSAGIAVKVLGLKPYAYAGTDVKQRTVAVPLDRPLLNAANNSVAASGSSTYSFGVSFRNLPDGADVTVNVGCEVFCGDGTTVFPTVVAITVSEPTHNE
jgi:hypothetical protein